MTQMASLHCGSVTRRCLILGALALAALVAACATEAASDSTSATVVMLDNEFDQDVYRVDVGTTVTFVNEGRNPHNAVAADGSWSTEDSFGDLVMVEGDETQITFDEPGEYFFICTFHAANDEGMVATLIVGDAAPTGATDVAGAEPPADASTRRVPGDYPTIQSAVDAAQPGDLILIAPGVYREEVAVATERLTLRGEDRNETIIDGEFARENGIIIVADGVAVENLTTRNANGNGVFWTGVTGFRGSYLTSYHTGNYGIYAFDSSDGLLEHSHASGSPDAGFYVGQCDPCRTVVTNVVSEYNGMGYSGTNASVDMYVIDSVWRNNGAGIVPNSLDGEKLPPVHDVTIIGNLIHDNGRTDVPFKNATWPAYGNGVIVAGGNDSLVARNRIVNHPGNGVLIPPNLDKNFWISSGNMVRDNVIEGSGRADLALGGPAGDGNCFENNDHTTSIPVGLEAFQSCGGFRLPVRWELAGTLEPLGRIAENTRGTRPDAAVGSTPIPPSQERLPGGAGAPVRPAVDVFASYDLQLDQLTVPDLPSGVTVTQEKGLTLFGILLATSGWSIYFGLWAYLMPFMLFAALLAVKLWDIVRREDLSRTATIVWIAIGLLLPFVGILAYFLFGKSSIPAWQRLAIVGGGLAAYLVLFAVGAVVGGIV